MQVTLLGTGCPIVTPHRMGPANLVRAGERTLLVECGSGVTQRMVEAGATGADLDAVFLTHLHSDHVIDLYQLILSSWHQGRDRPQRIFGPAGTRAFAQGLMEVWRAEREARIAFEARPSTAALDLAIVEFEEGVVFDEGGVRVSAFLVDHGPVKPAFGFLFESAGGRVAFSGDTTVCDNLVRWSRGADVLIHEVFIHREMVARRGRHSEQGLRNVASYHTPSTDIGAVARGVGPGLLVLNHFVPVQFDRDALLREVQGAFDGDLVLGEDLLTIDVARRALAFDDLHLALARRDA